MYTLEHTEITERACIGKVEVITVVQRRAQLWPQ